MYRIELSPGEETAFRSIEELAVAIRRGVVTSKARIWHNASSKWLPIQFHPHYKAAAQMPLSNADLVAGPPVAPLASLHLPDPNAPASRVTPFRPVFPQPEPAAPTIRVEPFRPASPYHQPEPKIPAAPSDLPFIEPLGSVSPPRLPKPEPLRMEPARPQPPKPQPMKAHPPKPQLVMKVEPRVEEQAPRKKRRSRARKPARRALRVAFVGALLIAGVQVLLSAVPSLRPDGLRAQRRLIAVLPETITRDSPRTVAAVIPALRNSSMPGGAALTHSSVPRPRSTAARPPAPTIAPATASAPKPSPSAVDSAPKIQPAPAVEMPVAAPAVTDSLTSNLVDSTGKKTLKGILRAVSGAPVTEKSPKKR